MKISVITINYNNLTGLERTLTSVLAQKDVEFEYIVIDGGSTDGSREAIERVEDRLTYWTSEADRGIYHAMNKGIEQANGEFCLFMNSGDTFHDSLVLSKVTPILKGKDFYSGNQRNVGSSSKRVQSPCSIRAGWIANHFLPHQATFIRTSLLQERPYDEKYRICSDWKQMLEELILYNATYEHLDFTIADFDTKGISHDKKYNELHETEQRQILNELFPPRIVAELIGENKTERKMRVALANEDKWKRDVKLLRNLLKQMPRDLWTKLTKKK